LNVSADGSRRRPEPAIGEGNLVELVIEGDKAVPLSKKVIDSSQAYFWTSKWQKAEKEASEDLQAGRVKRYNTVDDMLDDLDAECHLAPLR
jgi:hypothetical protein